MFGFFHVLFLALLGNEMESIAFNPQYPSVLGKHMWCACVEVRIQRRERERMREEMIDKTV